jgi:type I pantothenate kinase
MVLCHPLRPFGAPPPQRGEGVWLAVGVAKPHSPVTPPPIERDQPLFSPYARFNRSQWARLRAATPLTLTDEDLVKLRGLNEYVSLDEVRDIYLPLSRLLNLYVQAAQGLHVVTDLFLGKPPTPAPYVIGIAGSVAVGKSTFSRILRALLARWPSHPKVDLVTTDGFLYPNRVLEARGLMGRKGFPESYDLRRLTRFLADLKAGASNVRYPVYSHLTYDIMPGQEKVIQQPDIVLLEGLNVLQTPDGARRPTLRVFVSDFFDFSIYIDAREEDIEEWYVQRFLKLRDTAFQDPNSYFRRYGELSDKQADATAHQIWRQINGPNLRENIAPTRERASVVLVKSADHSVQEIRLRRI